MSYEFVKHKINKLWNDIIGLKSDTEQLESAKIETKIEYTNKKQDQYIIEEDYNFIEHNHVFTFSILLRGFPVNLLPYIKLNVLFSVDGANINFKTWNEYNDLSSSEQNNYNYILQGNNYFIRQIGEDYYLIGKITARLEGWRRTPALVVISYPIYGKIYLTIENPREYNALQSNKT